MIIGDLFCGAAATLSTIVVDPATGDVVDVYAAPARLMRTVDTRSGEVSRPQLMPRCETFTVAHDTGEVLELAIEV